MLTRRDQLRMKEAKGTDAEEAPAAGQASAPSAADAGARKRSSVAAVCESDDKMKDDDVDEKEKEAQRTPVRRELFPAPAQLGFLNQLSSRSKRRRTDVREPGAPLAPSTEEAVIEAQVAPKAKAKAKAKSKAKAAAKAAAAPENEDAPMAEGEGEGGAKGTGRGRGRGRGRGGRGRGRGGVPDAPSAIAGQDLRDDAMKDGIVYLASRCQSLDFEQLKKTLLAERAPADGKIQFSSYWTKTYVGLKALHLPGSPQILMYMIKSTQAPQGGSWNLRMAVSFLAANLMATRRCLKDVCVDGVST